MQAVCGWYAAGIPARHHLVLWQMAKRARLDWRPPHTDGVDLVPLPPQPRPLAPGAAAMAETENAA